MSITYAGIRGNKDLTLPSVQGWGTNLNIMKDPPRGIFTRKKTRVGDDNRILDEIKGSGNRVAENIMVYQRGVNPFVEVDMGGSGTQGGGLTSISKVQPKLPHRILNNGAFRPPSHIFEQRNILPLSRLPRRAVHVATNPESIRYEKLVNPDYVKAASNPKLVIENFQVDKRFANKDGYSNYDYQLDKNVPNHSMKTNIQGLQKFGQMNYNKKHTRNLPNRGFMINKGDKRIDLSNTNVDRDFTRLREQSKFGNASFEDRGIVSSKIYRDIPQSVVSSVKETNLRNKSSDIYNQYIFRN